MIRWLDGKTVDVNTYWNTMRQMLVWLNKVKVTGWSDGKTVISVQLKFHIDKMVISSIWSATITEISPSVSKTTSSSNYDWLRLQCASGGE